MGFRMQKVETCPILVWGQGRRGAAVDLVHPHLKFIGSRGSEFRALLVSDSGKGFKTCLPCQNFKRKCWEELSVNPKFGNIL